MSWTGTRWIGAQSRTTYGGYGIGSSRRACLSPVRRNGARRVLRGRRRSNAPPLPDYWAVDALAELGATVHLAHPLGVKAISYRRVKNDQRDAADLADLLRMGRLPHAWIAPPETRNCGSWCGTGPNWSRCDPSARPTSTRFWPRAVSGCRCPTCSASRETCCWTTSRCPHRTRRGSPRCAGSSKPSTRRSTCSPVWRSVG